MAVVICSRCGKYGLGLLLVLLLWWWWCGLWGVSGGVLAGDAEYEGVRGRLGLRKVVSRGLGLILLLLDGCEECVVDNDTAAGFIVVAVVVVPCLCEKRTRE
jgi:hypothetical protein